MNVSSPVPSPTSRSNRNRSVTAVLGPTNTGKTHLAIERLLGHESGVIGLPLRLLAREVYSKVAKRAGEHAVALITGEEKIVPADPRYWVCTVEAMPRDTDAAFVAVDEVQIAGDLERGHVFTDRILNLRGSQETLLLGAATMRPILERLLPGLNVITRPRMSVLAYSGQKKITRLPARSAIVAFSADDVYSIAELVRRQRGGAAVVMGALSPRTRNAQVELYQSGDVDFLIATDAVGMGLNLDVDHVAFAADRKFDGYQYRALTPAELGQIAGRAGRHMHDGTFGVTGRVDPFSDDVVQALETHAFEGVKVLQWRSRDIDTSSIDSLRASLDATPNRPELTRAPPASDLVALDHAMKDDDVLDRVGRPDGVRLLWDVCQLPDYRKIAPANHYELISQIFTQVSDKGHVDADWFETSVAQCSSPNGDIDTLANRIAHIRTWTFVAHRPDWLKNPDIWREKTQEIEDRLSDALHERLTQRFVDRRTSVLMRRLRENTMLDAEITSTGDVVVEGEHVGHLDGFRFTPASRGDSAEAKAVRAAATKVLAAEILRRADRVADADNSGFVLSGGETVRWQGEAIAKLAGGEDVLKPRVIVLSDEHLTGPAQEKVQKRLESWIANHVETLLKPLVDLRDAPDLVGIARGVAYRLVENLGSVERGEIGEDVRKLDQDTRAIMRRYGVRFGAYTIFVPALLKPAPSQLLAELWALGQPDMDIPGLVEIPQLSASGRTSVPYEQGWSAELYRVGGYRVCGNRAVRIDILERLADLIRPLISWRPSTNEPTPPDGALEKGGGFTVTVAMTSLLGCSGDDFSGVLRSLGYRVQRIEKPAEDVQERATENEPTSSDSDSVSLQAASADGEGEEPVAAETMDTPETPEEPSTAAPADVTGETDNSTPAVDAAEQDAPVTPDPAPSSDVPDQIAAEEPVEAAVSEESATEEASGAEESAPAAPVIIEIWRPGGERRRQNQARSRRDQPTEGNGGEGRQDREHRGRPRRTNGNDRRADGPPGGKRGDGPKNKRKGKPQRPAADQKPQRSQKPLDPDSPFAALAALKASMEKDGK